MLNYVVSTEYIKDAVGQVEIGAQRSGRELSAIDRPELLACSLSDDDPEAAIMMGKSLVAYYLGTEPHIMKASGADPSLVDKVKEIVGWPATEEDYKRAAHLIPDDLVRKLMAVGTSSECRDKVSEFIEAGVTALSCTRSWMTSNRLSNHFRIGKSESNVSENSSLGIDILIENTAVLLLDDDFTVVDPGWVAVTGDLIKEVGSGTLHERSRGC
ncbi:MAG: hypothetical protein CM15mP49_29560 [Actinomycetota bacterium]|nr:MAG: hypothetical protein CM15mP49_29560 [Actinomycetota bacterium]